MKRIIAIAAVAAVFASCAKEPSVKNDAEFGAIDGQKKSLTINMPSIATPGTGSVISDETTRTAFGTESASVMPVVWSAGDRIAVIQDKGLASQKISIYELDGPGGTASGTFNYVSGDASDADADIKDIIYPASAAAATYSIPLLQTYQEGQMDPDANLMVWHSDTGIGVDGVTPSPLGAVVRLNLKGVSGMTVSSISAKVNSTDYSLNCSPAVVMSSTSVPFYIAVPACSSQDIEFNLNVSGKAVKKVSLSKTFTAGSIRNFPECFAVDRGDLIENGVLYWVDNLLSENWVEIVSLDEANLAYSTKNVNNGTSSTNNLGVGIANTNKIVNSDGYKADPNTYPGAYWCVNHGAGWFLPSCWDLRNIYNALLLDGKGGIGAARGVALLNYYSADSFTENVYYMSSDESTASGRTATHYFGRQLSSGMGKSSIARSEERPVRACKRISF